MTLLRFRARARSDFFSMIQLLFTFYPFFAFRAHAEMNEIQWEYYSRPARNKRISILSFVRHIESLALS
jgi:hypothetical protein